VETIPLKDAPTGLYRGSGAALWDQVLAVLVRTMNPQSFNTWLKPTHELDRIGDVVRVSVPTPLFVQWIEKSYRPAINGALSGLGLSRMSVEFVPLDPDPPSRPNVFFDACARAEHERRTWQTDRGFDYPTFRTASGVLDKKHRQNIGAAIWEFLWCIDRQTGPHGLVLGGRPVTLAEIAGSFGVTRRHVSSALGRLGQHRYIAVTQNQRGLIIRVLNQKKFGPRRRRL